jgi:hypothetical protein
MYLAGKFGTDPNAVNAYAASSFFAVDRFAGFKQDWGSFYQEGGIVVADRYTTSNAVHQCSKLPREQWDAYLDWLFDFEYRLMGIPAPDAVVYLQVDPEVSQKLMTGRYQGDESKKDIHESNRGYLDKSRQAAEYCARKLGWQSGSLERYAPGCCIGGDVFGNREGLLPKKDGRIYYECDIDTMGGGSRGAKRIVYSNDGLVYYTSDHYGSFTLMYGEP